MALIKCKECGKEISDSAKTCPECGYVYKKDRFIIKTIIICVLVLFAVFLINYIGVRYPYIKESIQKKIYINKVIGNYKKNADSSNSMSDKIEINKDNIIYYCDHTMPNGIKENFYSIYAEKDNIYVITLSKERKEFVTYIYDEGKLVSKHIKNFQTKCTTAIEEHGETSNIKLEYQKER